MPQFKEGDVVLLSDRCAFADRRLYPKGLFVALRDTATSL